MPDSPLGPPLLGALLRMPVDVIRDRMLAALHSRGFDDLIAAHLIVLRYPGPDGRRPVDIAAQSGMSKQALNYQLGQLETLGYLERHPDADDHRSTRVTLTDRGHAAMRTLREAITEVEEEWSGLLGEDDIEQLRGLLLRLYVALE